MHKNQEKLMKRAGNKGYPEYPEYPGRWRRVMTILQYHKNYPHIQNSDAENGDMWISHNIYQMAVGGGIPVGTPIEIFVAGDNTRNESVATYSAEFVSVNPNGIDMIKVRNFRKLDHPIVYDYQVFNGRGTRVIYK